MRMLHSGLSGALRRYFGSFNLLDGEPPGQFKSQFQRFDSLLICHSRSSLRPTFSLLGNSPRNDSMEFSRLSGVTERSLSLILVVEERAIHGLSQ
jgi:hypothetical protein